VPGAMHYGFTADKSQMPEANAFLKHRVIEYIFGVLIILVCCSALLLLYIHPHFPIDLCGWFILIFIGVPIYFYLEWIGETIFNKKVGQEISGKKVSVKRIMLLLLVSIGLAGVYIIFWFIFRPFFRSHFS
jgi:hypothetical protein